MKQKRRVLEVRTFKGWPVYTHWVVIEKRFEVEHARTKKEAIILGAGECRDIVRAGGTAQLRVYNKNGRIAFERTYPRSSDPKRRKG